MRMPAGTVEFRWTEQAGNRIIVSRHWAGGPDRCPGCMTQAVTAAYHDTDSNQVRVRFNDQTQQAVDFHLVESHGNSAQFLSNTALHTYRLTLERLPEG